MEGLSWAPHTNGKRANGEENKTEDASTLNHRDTGLAGKTH